MFREADIGLEAPTSQLAMLLPDIPIDSITTVLRYSGLARMSGGTDPRFSFVHRRLNEYFVARRLLNDPMSVALEAIPTDSRYRDALALYCEVGEAVHVKNIAAFCWREIVTVRPDLATTADHLRAVHCLRFLRDAFRTRPETIDFVPELARYIKDRLQPGGDLLAAKIAMEAAGLLPENQAEPVLVEALRMRNPWISETALHACRHLKRIGRNLDEGLFQYLRSIPIREFLHRNREIIFSLSLSDAFRGLRRYCVLRSIDNRAFVAAVAFCLLTSPALAITFALLLLPAIWLPEKLRRRLPLQTAWRGYLGVLIAVLSCNRLFGPPGIAGRSIRVLLAATPGPLRGLSPTAYQALLPGFRLAHGSGIAYVAAAYILLALAVSPCVDIAFIFRGAPWRVLFSLKGFVALSAAIAAIVSLTIGVIKLFELIDPWIARHRFILVIVFVGLFGIPMLFNTFRSLWLLYKDRGHFQRVTRSTALTRQAIARDFVCFRTLWYRSRYVEWLRDVQVQPVGNWNPSRPNIGNDAASTMLAQLDERWLAMEV